MAQLQQVQLANNTSAQATNDSVSALTVDTQELYAPLLQTQQQLAMFIRVPAGAPPATPPTKPHVQAPPHTAYGRGVRQRRTGGQGSGGRTRNIGQSYAPTATVPPPYGVTRPAANMNGRTNSIPNPNKNYNNCNMCFLCVYDIPIWHTNATCDNCKPGHQTGGNGSNVEQYTAVVHYVSRRAIH